jgi:hypothetical protein
MSGQQLVLKYQNGTIIKGWVDNFNPDREIFFLHPLKEYSDEEKLDIKLKDLKAIFFVKDFIGNEEYQKVRSFKGSEGKISPTQRPVIVYFNDGEKLYGTTYSYNPTKTGFYVYPFRREDNNVRIFAINSAIEKVGFPDSLTEGDNL